MSRARLRPVPEPADEPAPDLSYEWRDRQRIRERDWAAVHIRGDRGPALPFFQRILRTWRR